MDSSYLSALAGMGGAIISALSSVSSSWFTFRAQTRSQRSAQKIERLQDLYKDFIEQASKFYANSLIHSSTDVLQLIQLYVLISRMRVFSSPAVVENAEKVARTIVDNYVAPNKVFAESIAAGVASATASERWSAALFATTSIPVYCTALRLFSLVR